MLRGGHHVLHIQVGLAAILSMLLLTGIVCTVSSDINCHRFYWEMEVVLEEGQVGWTEGLLDGRKDSLGAEWLPSLLSML